MMMHKNRSVDAHDFSMIPKAEIPRSSFKMQKTLKTTFDSGFIVPMLCEEVLPGDTFNLRMTAFVRLATPIFPIMDNLHFETFFFFVPCRLLWTNFKKFMGEQEVPGASISFVIPQLVSPIGGFAVGGLYDYFGLPTAGQVGGALTVSVNALPLRAYNLIYNDWFKDENLISNVTFSPQSDGPDSNTQYVMLRRGKRKDYFTGCLPWPQKGNTAVTLPLGTSAPVKSDGNPFQVGQAGAALTQMVRAAGAGTNVTMNAASTAGNLSFGLAGTTTTGLFADLSGATAATINQLRQAFQIQKLLERDARGGTRYTEIVRAHFGVVSPDARLQRPEYLGGGSAPISVNPIAQTSATGVTGGTTPVGSLAAMGTGLAQGHGFTQSFTEHGYIIGLMNVRADLTYQQGLRKMWSRSTRYDFYFPAFAMLGEQAVLQKEIFSDGSGSDNSVFGYQERWAEYRFLPSQITGLFRSTSTGTVDPWHLAQRFTVAPTLGQTFIEEAPPLSRVLAVGAAANGQQMLMDAFFDITAARPLPMYSVPGLIDHF